MKVIYTDSGSQALESYQSQRKKELEDYIKQEKYVFGDEFIEITASDIKNAEKTLTYIKPNRKSSLPFTSMLLKIYMLMGLTMVVYGIFYEQIMSFLYEGPTKQVLFIIGGVLLSLFSAVGHYYIQKRNERMARQKSLEMKARRFENSDE